MEKRISVTNFRAIKRIAQAVNPLVMKKNRLKEQIDALTLEYNDYVAQIKGMEQGVIAMTGFQSEDLVMKVVEPTGKVDKEGKPIKNTKYVPTKMVTKDEETNEYVITIPSPDASDEAPAVEGNATIHFEEEGTQETQQADIF